MTETIKIRRPDDMHLHLRNVPEAAAFARASALSFARAVVMPNTLPPVTTPGRVERYREEISAAAPGFTPLMTFKLVPGMGAKEIEALSRAGALAGKYYPANATTNAEDGVPSPESVAKALGEMERLGLVLSIHGELPTAFCLDREAAFLPVLEGIAEAHPDLKIVFEHVSSREGLAAVLALPRNVAATVTVHHLLFTLDDIAGGALSPHFFCKPILKRPEDRDALQRAVLSRNPKLFFGSDSAPHPIKRKEGPKAPGGIFSAPAALPLLAEFFVGAGKVDAFEDFVSRFGAEFYGLEPNEGQITLVREPWRVPDEIAGAAPLLAGSTLSWSLA
jgi:dihydroorotase